jgi:hypothetical protein
MVRTDRNLLRQRLHVALDDALRVELRWHHIAVEQRYRTQVWQAVIRLFLGTDDLSTPLEAATREVKGELEHLCLDRDN